MELKPVPALGPGDREGARREDQHPTTTTKKSCRAWSFRAFPNAWIYRVG